MSVLQGKTCLIRSAFAKAGCTDIFRCPSNIVATRFIPPPFTTPSIMIPVDGPAAVVTQSVRPYVHRPRGESSDEVSGSPGAGWRSELGEMGSQGRSRVGVGMRGE